jgi:uncharacterized phage protein (TIGR01671 family)
MRELKFRIWDEENKKFIYSDDYTEFYEFFEMPCNGKEDECEQYTGILDKNGKEIFEGDIVKYKRWYGNAAGDEQTSDVKYKAIQFIKTESGFWPFVWFNGGLIITETIEIIGNIHEQEKKNEV